MSDNYPAGDAQFKEYRIDSVAHDESDGTYTITCDGWSLWCGESCAVEPKPGQIARMYGGGIGFPVRGLFIGGVEIWYRTDAEEKDNREIESFGSDATEWLRRWDEGRSVWSIEMGGLGPGYEQAIQITVAEVLRHMLAAKYDAALWEDRDIWQRNLEAIRQYGFANEAIKALGLSGAQWGAAVNLACQFYRHGPRGVMNDPRVKYRHIQVARVFPGMAA